jgi:hypothetical protein
MQIISLYEQEKSEEGLPISELEHLHRRNLAFPECQGRPTCARSALIEMTSVWRSQGANLST